LEDLRKRSEKAERNNAQQDNNLSLFDETGMENSIAVSCGFSEDQKNFKKGNDPVLHCRDDRID
jgi:hypothetical protein